MAGLGRAAPSSGTARWLFGLPPRVGHRDLHYHRGGHALEVHGGRHALARGALERPRWASSHCLRPPRSALGPAQTTRPRVHLEPTDSAAGSRRTSVFPSGRSLRDAATPGGAFGELITVLSEVSTAPVPCRSWSACWCPSTTELPGHYALDSVIVRRRPSCSPA